MGLRLQADVSPAGWIVRSTVPWHLLVTWGPEGFTSCVRVRYTPAPVRPGRGGRDFPGRPRERPGAGTLSDHAALDLHLNSPSGLLLPVGGRPRPLSTTEPSTGRPRSSSVHPSQPTSGRCRRISILLGGSLPAFAWPEDRAWCFTNDVDPHWAGIAGSDEAIKPLWSQILTSTSCEPASGRRPRRPTEPPEGSLHP